MVAAAAVVARHGACVRACAAGTGGPGLKNDVGGLNSRTDFGRLKPQCLASGCSLLEKGDCLSNRILDYCRKCRQHADNVEHDLQAASD